MLYNALKASGNVAGALIQHGNFTLPKDYCDKKGNM
jgi:hypothetical protein